MIGRTHDLAAITALGVVVVLQPVPVVSLSTAILAIIANQLGGIAPDIDQPTAPFWNNLPVGGFFGKFFGKMSGGHRFITHSILGLALFGFLVHLLLVFLTPIMPNVDTGYVWWAFMIGMLSHLVMDTLTKEGVPWFLPIPVKFGFPPLRSWRITSGKKFELWVVFPALLAFDIWFCMHYSQTILTIIHQHIV